MIDTENPVNQKAYQRSEPLVEIAYKKIKNLIWQKKFVPGQRLTYDDLEQQLKMSRTPIINALMRLEQQGITVYQSYRGFQIRPMDIQEIWDTFGYREALETYAVTQAIEVSEPQDFIALEEKLAAHDDYTPPHYDLKKRQLASQFHLHIAEMSKNRLLKRHLNITLEHIFLRVDLDIHNIQRMPRSSKEHHELVECMKNKDIIGSVEVIRNHVRGNRDYAISCFSKKELIDEDFTQ